MGEVLALAIYGMIRSLGLVVEVAARLIGWVFRVVWALVVFVIEWCRAGAEEREQ